MQRMTIILAGLAFSIALQASGPISSGGGNGALAQFESMAREFLKVVQKSPSLAPPISVAELKTTIENATLESAGSALYLNGSKVDAINEPEARKITLDTETWAERGIKEKYQIVIHEFLGLMEIPDPRYGVSDLLTKDTLPFTGLNPVLNCGASPRELRCKTENGRYALSTQLNRDDHYDDFDGFWTRHECSLNETLVDGLELGAEAQLNSKFISHDFDPFTVMIRDRQENVIASTYWSIRLSPTNVAKTGVTELKLIREPGQKRTLHVIRDGVYESLPVTCE